MGRPRTASNRLLPAGVYFKHGAFYTIIKGKWHRIGTDMEQAVKSHASIPRRMPAYKIEMRNFVMRLVGRAKQNAKGRRGIEFDLTGDDVEGLLEGCNWRCAVTGRHFSMDIVGGKRPYAPSIDRIDNAKGYLRGNCRVVCVAVNYAMNVWGEEVLWQLFSKRKETVLASISHLAEKMA